MEVKSINPNPFFLPMTQFVDEMYLANLIRRNGTCFIGRYLILVYKATLGLAVFYL